MSRPDRDRPGQKNRGPTTPPEPAEPTAPAATTSTPGESGAPSAEDLHAAPAVVVPPRPPLPAQHQPHVDPDPPATPAPGETPATPDPLASAAKAVTTAATVLATEADTFDLTTEKLTSLTQAYRQVTDALSQVDAEVRKKVTDDVHLKDVDSLLAVAALSESLREWFPVDPEMTSVRGTVLVPQAMTAKKPPAPEQGKPEDESFDALLKKLLAHLAG
mgnify:FL=1